MTGNEVMKPNRRCNIGECGMSSEPTTAKCYLCSGEFHLECFEIPFTSAKLFSSKNIAFICDSCMQDEPERKRKQNDANKLSQATIDVNNSGLTIGKTATPTSKKTPITSTTVLAAVKLLSDKIDKHSELLKQIDTNVKSIDCNQVAKIGQKSQSTTGMDDNENVNNFTPVRSRKNGKGTRRAPAPPVMNEANFPPMNSRNNNKRSGSHSSSSAPKSYAQVTADEAVLKTQIKKRQLTAGAGTSDRLGNAVEVKTFKVERVKLSKSLFVSRFETKITEDDVYTHVREKMPDIDERHYKIHILVKKDANIEELPYVSFRVACTPQLYNVFKAPDFWPAHIMYGDFIEKPSRKRSKLGEFIPEQFKKSDLNEQEFSLDSSIEIIVTDGTQKNSNVEKANEQITATDTKEAATANDNNVEMREDN